jgi:hypothetical protein
LEKPTTSIELRSVLKEAAEITHDTDAAGATLSNGATQPSIPLLRKLPLHSDIMVINPTYLAQRTRSCTESSRLSSSSDVHMDEDEPVTRENMADSG